MKYWWLEKYQNIEVRLLPQLFSDIEYFLTMPKNYNKIYNQLKEVNFEQLTEEELCIILYRIAVTKNVKDETLRKVIDKLLKIPDTSLPISDYTFHEIFDEIKNLKLKKPTVDKLEINNVAACYNCLNVFYVDKIKKANKKGHCLCPFCKKDKIYFDNDLVPMNYSFLYLSKIYYGISNLGCDFTKIKKLLKKGLFIEKSDSIEEEKKNNLEFLEKYKVEKICCEDEQKIIKQLYDEMRSGEKIGIYEKILLIDWNTNRNALELANLLVISSIESLSNSFYLKKINIIINNENVIRNLNNILHILTKRNV